MMEVVTGKSYGKYAKNPTVKAVQLENLTGALKFINAQGLKLVNIGPSDIHDGDTKLILGLLWTIIYHFQVSKGFKDAGQPHGKKGGGIRDLLLEWVRSKIPEYNIQNFNKDWVDGRAIAALVNAVGGEPWIMPEHKMMIVGAKVLNATKAIDAAYEHFGIPKIISPQDLTNPDVDDLSVMTYVSFFRDAQRKGADGAASAASASSSAAAGSSSASGQKQKPWERPSTWRNYTKPDLGGRQKIRGYYSTTTSSEKIRANTRNLQDVLEEKGFHLRPDFVPWTPVDVDMDKATRDQLFNRAGTRETPLLFVDDEFVGTYDQIINMIENSTFDKIFDY